ncbi:MAG: iron ABC transporter permease [Proteobacteria bacterium]|nr:iron ABC transporter permease [Pseudomonadota bacterium]
MVEKINTLGTEKRLSYAFLLLLSFLLLFILLIVSAGMGFMDISFMDVTKAIVETLSGKTGILAGPADQIRAVVVDVRLPRIMAALLVGAGLSVSGAVFQGILLNPLADPYTLGVSAGAAFGAAMALVLNMGATFYSVPLFAFAGAALTLFFVIFLASSGHSGKTGLSSSNLILSGIIISAILSAGISFLKYLADEQVSAIIFWLMGSFAAAAWAHVLLLSCALGLCSGIFLFYARDLNLMSLGEKSAVTLGVDTAKVTLILLISASFLAALCVSVSGIIGFVGLLIPHMVRFVTGPDNRKLLPLSFTAGAILLLGADTLTRAVLPSEIPIGVLTALIGGPVFCYIFKKRHMTERQG